MNRAFDFVQRIFRRLGSRWRILRIVKWLSQQEGIVWLSVIEPTPAAQAEGLPKMDVYRALRAIMEVKDASGSIEWHFLWGTESEANVYESDILTRFGSPCKSARRLAVRHVRRRKDAFLTRVGQSLLGVFTITGAATLLINLEVLKTFFFGLWHSPEMTLESSTMLQVATGQEQFGEITIRGDPYFRTQLSDLSMRTVPRSKASATSASHEAQKEMVPHSNRSVDIGDTMKLLLPFKNLSAGEYDVFLHGRVRAGGFPAAFDPQEPIKLLIRDPVSVGYKSIKPWTQLPDGKFAEVLVDLRLDFGRPKKAKSDLEVYLPGKWAEWSIEDLEPGVTVERWSQNSSESPKAVQFALRDFPSEEFSVQPLRLRIRATSPLSKEEWLQRILEPEVAISR